ncbi:MAG: nucleotide excision repair endonuclease [Peptostreptococcaceae bacterium]|nr:nucleotide excision repair endonuclease [Peptostreptococcaceae bacterium]
MIQRKGYCYRFMSDKNQVLYVGKTVNMDARMKNHFSKKSHLHGSGLYEQVQRIEYITCKSEYDALQKELAYINFYKPRYNSASKIKQLIDPPGNDKWKVYKVIRPLTREQEKTNENMRRFLPIAICLFFISIIIFMI